MNEIKQNKDYSELDSEKRANIPQKFTYHLL